MRTKLLSFLLIISFIVGSVPIALAQEVAESIASEESTETAVPAETQGEPESVITADTGPETALEIPEAPDFEPIELEARALDARVTDVPVIEELLAEPPVAVSVETEISLPNGCTAEDTEDTLHIFPLPETISAEYLAICALAEAAENGSISGFELTNNPSFGLYVTAVDGREADSTSEYWALWHNGEYAACGIGCLELAEGDTLSLILTTFDNEESDSYTFTVVSLDDEFDNVVVENGCDVTATDGSTHAFPADSSPSEYLAICALAEAAENGSISGFELTNNPSFGLYVTAVDGREADSTSEYWALWHNGEYAACGIGCLPVEAGDVVSLILTTFDQAESERTNVRVIALVETEEEPGEGTPGDGSGGAVQSFDLPTAYDFLKEGQDTDGSWNSELVTDWSAFALAASGAPAGMKSRLVSYLKEEEPDFESVRDYERHAMALMALGINPYTGGPSDYITPIVESFDGKQIDEPGIMNDDVFALIPLLHAGYGKEDEIIQETTAFIVDEQNGDGSWEGSVDMTAATIQALSQVRSLPGVQAALADAESYLREEQEADGGFGDPFATSWVLQAIEALGDSPADWKVGENTPLTYLAKVQAEDGGMKTTPDDYDTRAWATAYAIPAAKGLTWDDILRDFKKPVGTTTESEDASDGENATTTEDVLSVAFDEPLIAPYFATSTLAIAPEARVTAVTTPEPPVNDSVTEEVTDADGIIETPPNELVAGAGESGAWEWFKRMLGGFWSFVMELFS